jgi:hypothetical protein
MEERVYQNPAELIATIPWGTHCCHFYKTQKDLLDLLVPYLKQGLLNNEFCMWVTSKHLGDVMCGEYVNSPFCQRIVGNYFVSSKSECDRKSLDPALPELLYLCRSRIGAAEQQE